MTKEEIVNNFMASHEPDTLIPNPDGFYFYYSEDMTSGINLVHFFQDLVEYVLELNNADNAKKDAEIKRIDEYCFDLTNHRDSLQTKYNELKQLADENAINFAEWVERKCYCTGNKIYNYENGYYNMKQLYELYQTHTK